MSTTSKEFIKQMLEEGLKHSYVQQFRTIAKMKISFGYSGYVAGHKTSDLFKPYNSPENSEYVATEVSGRLRELGGKSDAIVGLMVEVPMDSVKNSEFVTWDQKNFTDQNRDQKDFDAIIEAVLALDCPINKWFWCAYERIESPSAVEQGDKGKYEKKDAAGNPTGEFAYSRIMLPVEKYADELAALEAVTTTTDSDSQTELDEPWSATARESYVNLNDIKKDEVLEWYTKAKDGVPYVNDAENFPLPKPPMPKTPVNIAAYEEAIKGYIGQLYQLETSDIDYIVATTTPI